MLKTLRILSGGRSLTFLSQFLKTPSSTDRDYRNILKVLSCSHGGLQSNRFYANVSSLISDVEPEKVSDNEYGDIDIEAITKGDKDLEKKLKVLILEVDMYSQDGRLVPDVLKKQHWQELLDCSTRNKRIKYLEYLFKLEKKAENKKLKKEQYLSERLQQIEEEKENDDGHIKYGFRGSTIFIRVSDATMDRLGNNRLIKAMQFSQHIVLDCDYSQHMTKREISNCAKQMCLMFSDNRNHNDPFNLWFCNARRDDSLIQNFQKFIPPLYDDDFPINITEKSYLDLYPKEKLVYLTPHSKTELSTYDHDAVYIIGGIVDKGNNEPLSLAKAKKEGLKMAKLPLDEYLMWTGGSGKSLTLDQMIKIMLDIRFTGDWNVALKHVPRRKLITDDTKILLNPNLIKKEKFLKAKSKFNRKMNIEDLFNQ